MYRQLIFYQLPADSRDFALDGNYIPDSNIRWQINETARYGKDRDREIEQKRQCPDPRGPTEVVQRYRRWVLP